MFIRNIKKLESTIVNIVNEHLHSTECIYGWEETPAGDIVVFLLDKALEKATEPVVRKLKTELGRGRTLVFGQQEEKWVLISFGGWGGGVGRLLKYFNAMLSAEQSPQWLAGVELSNSWLSFYSSSPTQSQINDFVFRLNDEPNPGAVWLDFKQQFIHWARCRGFQTS
jgi:hypothetical protein